MNYKGAAIIFFMKNYMDKNNIIHSNVILFVYEKGYYDKIQKKFIRFKYCGPIAGRKSNKENEPYLTIVRECHEEATIELIKFIPKNYSLIFNNTPIFIGEAPKGFSRSKWNPSQYPRETLGLEWIDLDKILNSIPSNHYKFLKTINVDNKDIYISKFAVNLIKEINKLNYIK